MARFASQKRHTTSIMHRFKFRLTCRAKDALFMHRAIMSSMDQVLLLCPRPLISLYVSIWASPLDLWYPRPRFRAWTGGGDREAGSWQADVIRNIMGQLGSIWSYQDALPGGTGALSWITSGEGGFAVSSKITMQGIGFDASHAVPTAAENRPVNIAVHIILYLGLSA